MSGTDIHMVLDAVYGTDTYLGYGVLPAMCLRASYAMSGSDVDIVVPVGAEQAAGLCVQGHPGQSTTRRNQRHATTFSAPFVLGMPCLAFDFAQCVSSQLFL